jgi:hypothetical protein
MVESFSEQSIKKFLASGQQATAQKWRGIEVKSGPHGAQLFKGGRQIVPIERIDDVLQALYDDPATGLKSYAQLWQTVKERFHGISSKRVKQFTGSQETEQTQKPVVKARVNKPIIKSAPNEQWNIDLVDLSEFAGLNNGVKYLLTVIDAFSKRAWVYGLKNKEDKGVSDSMQAIFESDGKPLVVVSDNGSEFISHDLNQLLDLYDVRHIYTKAYSPQSNAQIERFNKTIKTKIYKFMQHYNTQHYIDALADLVKNYNNTVHSVTKRKPIELHALAIENPRSNAKVSLETQAQFDEAKRGIEKQAAKWLDETAELPLKDNIVQGTYVRIAEETKVEVKRSKLFRKSYERKWSQEIYKVAYVNLAEKDTQPDSYTLMDSTGEIMNGVYYRDQLQAVNIKELKKFDGERPDFSNGRVFNREKFLKEDLPNREVIEQPVEPLPARREPSKRVRKPNVRLKDIGE